jgi:4'-phosphopantetheinyl transferase
MAGPAQLQSLRPQPWWPGQPLPRPAAQRPGDGASLEPWLLRVDRSNPRVLAVSAELEALLSCQDRDHVNRLRRPDDRQRTLLGRGVLRLVLGAWLGLDPAALRFAAGAHGKPQLLHPGPSTPQGKLHQGKLPQGKLPQFNISHSGDLILLAFHAAAPVGVDVERQQPDLDWRPIARRCLAPAQVESLLALPPAEAASAFVECWCALEAGLKARGVGLSQASEVHALAIEPQLRRWRLDLPAGYSGAVALLDPA